MFYKRLFNVNGKTNGLFRMAIHPPYDPDEALADQIEMIKYLKEWESTTTKREIGGNVLNRIITYTGVESRNILSNDY